MILLDDHDELSPSPDDEELSLVSRLGPAGLQTIDANLTRHANHHWLKVARVVVDAIKAGGFSVNDEGQVRLHVRRLIGLTEVGALDGQGDLRRPRWSEVRLPDRG